MEMLNFAKEMELQGKDHYTALAEKTPVRELSGIFAFLAQEEQRHYNIFDSWQKNEKLPSVEDTKVLSHTKETFQKLSEHFKTDGMPALDRDDAFEKALTFENKSIDFYSEAQNKLEPGPQQEQQRTVLASIIDQEKKHARIIDALMKFQRHPGEWLENAEWYHLDEF